ncbi:glycosyltransferase family 4 protein [Photorhabdus kayaii]|uniref:glycosyltransferase family 4 protein n=1 Tax=Photorhabdus kayaii TaxID=230088 RepID=UPI0021D4E229|nr:glycosyltransferase family 4 protein [Photorhabdus kayaii]MCT8351849.1 glycosyltransferase family 4 protein [Photorhabdus kayaii]
MPSNGGTAVTIINTSTPYNMYIHTLVSRAKGDSVPTCVKPVDDNSHWLLRNSMRIVYFVNAAWYFELHWLDRSEAVIKQGYEVHLISCFSDEKIKKNLEDKGIICWDVKLNRFSKNILKNISILKSFRKICKQIHPDIIHLITIKPIIFGGLYTRFSGIPFVVSFVGLGRLFGDKKGIIGNFIYQSVLFIYRLLLSYNSPAHVIFEHNADYNELSKYIKFNKKNVHVIEGAGVDRLRFSYQPEPNDGNFSILFASRLLWSKGLGLVVEAIEKLKQQNIKNITLNVAGILDDSDPDRIKIEQILEWEEQGKIVWLGRRNDVQELIKNCHIVILPTIYSEGVPRIIIEACAMGRSCIVGNVAGCKAIIIDNFNGCVLQDHSATKIAEKIKYLQTNSRIRKEFGFRSTDIVEKRFSKEIVIDKTLQVYNSLLGKIKW